MAGIVFINSARRGDDRYEPYICCLAGLVAALVPNLVAGSEMASVLGRRARPIVERDSGFAYLAPLTKVFLLPFPPLALDLQLACLLDGLLALLLRALIGPSEQTSEDEQRAN